MKIRNDQKGFSLVEMIVVAGIISILVGISVTLLGYLKVANAEKAVQTVSMALSKQQAQTMSKQTKPYVYLYQLDGEVYVCTSFTDLSGFDASVLTKEAGTSLGGVEVYSVSKYGGETQVTGTNYIKLYYKRNGSFGMDEETGCHGIVIKSPNSTRKISLIYVSGKHVVE